MAPFGRVIRHMYVYPLVCRMKQFLLVNTCYIVYEHHNIPLGEGSLSSIPVLY